MARAGLVLLALVAASGCSSRGSTGDTSRVDAGPDDTGVLDDGAAGDGARPDLGIVFVDGGPAADDTIVYAHSNDTLYGFDPRTNHVTPIGPFLLADGTAVGPVTDLAVTQANEIYACTADALYRVDTLTARSTFLTSLTVPAFDNFNGLTFVPVGVLDPTSEVLVGATFNGDYYRIDTGTGASTLVGHYGGGFGSSGDLVSVAGAGPGGGVGTFATVNGGGFGSDHLVLLDPATGGTTDLGDIGFSQVYGLGYWRSKLYGFTSVGELVLIDIHTGHGTLVTASTGSSEFYGAGVTTRAPTLI